MRFRWDKFVWFWTQSPMLMRVSYTYGYAQRFQRGDWIYIHGKLRRIICPHYGDSVWIA